MSATSDHEVDDVRLSLYQKRRLKQLYYSVRLFVLVAAVTSTKIAPPFDTSALILLDRTSPFSVIPDVLLRWDSFHFSSIALKGYVYEHQFAFMPGIPFVMRLFGEVVWRTRTLVSAGAKEGIAIEDVLIGGFFAAALLCDWTGDLYDLTMHYFDSPHIAYLTGLLSLIPLSPATLLLAPYSEPFFAALSFKGMLACARKQWLKASICFALATAFRSNGFILCGFIIWGLVVDIGARKVVSGGPLFTKDLILRTVYAAFLSVLIISPFIAHQARAYILFCSSDLPGRPWCKNRIPSIYSFVQKEYWGVGFLKYWTLSQIPNFLFAGPVLVLLLRLSGSELSQAAKVVFGQPKDQTDGIKSKGFRSNLKKLIDKGRRPPLTSWDTLPHAIHAMALTLLLLFASHTQIILRLSSSLPYTYWAIARLLYGDGQARRVEQDKRMSLMQRLRLSDGRFWGRVWVIYAVVWSMVSIVLWASFLPPA